MDLAVILSFLPWLQIFPRSRCQRTFCKRTHKEQNKFAPFVGGEKRICQSFSKEGGERELLCIQNLKRACKHCQMVLLHIQEEKEGHRFVAMNIGTIRRSVLRGICIETNILGVMRSRFFLRVIFHRWKNSAWIIYVQMCHSRISCDSFLPAATGQRRRATALWVAMIQAQVIASS